jgi:hypothetical protein
MGLPAHRRYRSAEATSLWRSTSRGTTICRLSGSLRPCACYGLAARCARSLMRWPRARCGTLPSIPARDLYGTSTGPRTTRRTTRAKTSRARARSAYSPASPARMRWLVRLVTPPGGTVLEPFAGSGTTLLACELGGLPVHRDRTGARVRRDHPSALRGPRGPARDAVRADPGRADPRGHPAAAVAFR